MSTNRENGQEPVERSRSPFALARRLLRDERVRFILVGGFNTVFGYLLFVAFELLLGHVVGYLVTLYLAFAIAILVAFWLHRHFTYRVTGTGNWFIDLLRFSSVSLVALAINTLALPLLVELAGLTPIIAQAIIVVITTLVSYFGHKLFSFRRRTHPVADAGAEAARAEQP